MPPKQVRIDPDVVYRSETPLQQRKFPARRRSVRPSRASAPPPVRQQSTLTQLSEWSFYTSPSSDVEDEHDDEDELESARPKKKKRRTAHDAKKQTTLTQIVPSSFLAERYDGTTDDLVRNSQDELFDGVPDSQSSSPASGPDHPWEGNKDSGGIRRDAMMGQDELSQEQEQEDRVDSALSKPQSRQRPSPDLSIPAMHLRTPKRRFRSEIPSSNTPQSANLSICTAKTMRSPERSPLRTKSTNIWSQQPSHDRMQMSPVPESPIKAVFPLRLSPVKNRPVFRVPDKPPTLQHRSTIPDSEDTATQITPFKLAKFRSQIPDTQFDMLGEEVAPVTETQYPIASYTQYGGETYYADNEDYHDLDPVCSALDRDAARFMQTQRLKEQLRHEAFRNALSFSQPEQEDEPVPATVQQSQELGHDLLLSPSNERLQDQEVDDPPTQSPQSSPHPQPQRESDDIEELDLTGDGIAPRISTLEVIRIASSPSSKSISSGKYPSSPPLAAEPDLPPRANPVGMNLNVQRRSSPPLPANNLQIPLSQVSTVGGTQFFLPVGKLNQGLADVSSSPPAHPPSTSSPPPEARKYLRNLLQVSDSEDEDELDMDGSQSPSHDDGDQDMDLDLVPPRSGRGNSQANAHFEQEQESEHTRNRSRLREILPDTLLDFSLPPPPTQSSLRSLRH